MAVRTELTESDWRLVPHVISEKKFLKISIERIISLVRNREKVFSQGNAGEWHFEHEVFSGTHQTLSVRLRLSIPYRSNLPVAWRCSLIMFNVRIDGICHHLTAPDGRGGACRGWHRHEWDIVKRSCNDLRNPLPEFDPGDTIEAFVVRCCEVMNIRATEGAEQC